MSWQSTSNGSAAFANTGLNFTYLAGYTGSRTSRAMILVNNAAGTANNPMSFSTTQGNLGFVASASSTTAGANIGGFGSADGGNVSIGLEGQSITAKNSATNIGVIGYSLNTGSTPIEIGVLATMNASLPSVSAALIADNGAETVPVALFQVNGVTKVQVDTSGNLISVNARADAGYSYQTPSTGFSITLGNTTFTTILDPAGTLATGTITMPASPVDGQMVQFSVSQIVTTLTVAANSGQSIKDAPTTVSAGGGFRYIYRLANTTWYRLQ
jgi:hypothetical protein